MIKTEVCLVTDLCFCVRMRVSITLRSACLHKSFPAEKGELTLEELKQNEQIQTPKTKKTDEFHLKQITIIALAIFITFCC